MDKSSSLRSARIYTAHSRERKKKPITPPASPASLLVVLYTLSPLLSFSVSHVFPSVIQPRSNKNPEQDHSDCKGEGTGRCWLIDS